MEPVTHCDAKQFSASLSKGQAEHRDCLKIADNVRAGVACGQNGSGFTRGERFRRLDDDCAPIRWRLNPRDLHSASFIGSRDETTKPAGGGVVWMSLEGACLFQNAIAGPAK